MKHIALTEAEIRCILDSDGTKMWYLNNERHRVDGPTIEYSDGSKEWYLNGKRHRADGPAIELSSGMKEWYINGNLHRADGPAVEHSDGTKEWYLDDKRHRIDGPAIEEPDGMKHWFFNDKLHRIGGPAVEWPTGMREWYLDDIELTEYDYYIILKTRKFRSRIIRSNNALGFNRVKALNLSRNKAVVEWYYSPDNGGGKIAKKRIEAIISCIRYSRDG